NRDPFLSEANQSAVRLIGTFHGAPYEQGKCQQILHCQERREEEIMVSGYQVARALGDGLGSRRIHREGKIQPVNE
ncbi:hypothetical protein chiPu_0022623, partial [Chiloscyllium punctatum]|nr:hypothetical protein [Chiloscyllium punctatum]